MDRRDFLKNTSAAAASVAAGTTAADAAVSSAAGPGGPQSASAAANAGATRLVLAAEWSAGMPGFSAQRLAHRIETVSGGRIAVEISTAADAHDAADLTFVDGRRHARLHPAFAFFAGLPGNQGLDASRLPGWLAVGGGQMLWDELATGFGFKPLLVGHTGPSTGLWSNRALDSLPDLAGAKVFAAGLAAEVLGSLGAEPVSLLPGELKAGLADGRLDAAEWLGPLAAVAQDFRPLADRLYAAAGLTPAGSATVLTVRLAVWNRLDGAQRTLLETCAAAEYQATLAELHAYAALDQHAIAQARSLPLPRDIVLALDRASRDAVERLAAADAECRRIADSHRAFRDSLANATTPTG